MTIADIIRRGRGTAHAWHVERDGNGTAKLVHYSTTMLVWNVARPGDPDVLDWDTGWGSVSDQNGMNTAFGVLGLPHYFSRAGGAEIVETWGSPHSLHDERGQHGVQQLGRAPSAEASRARFGGPFALRHGRSRNGIALRRSFTTFSLALAICITITLKSAVAATSP